MLLIPNALCWSSRKCNCACALPAEVQLRLRVTRRSWQKLLVGKNFVKILVTAQTQLRSYSEQQRAFGNSNICNWANFFHFSNLQTIRRPKLLETVRNGKTSTFLKVWFWENVKFVIVFSHHKLIQDSQEYFKHLEFSHILRMRKYRIRWKTLKMQKNRKIFQTNSHKSYEILQRICIRHHITSH